MWSIAGTSSTPVSQAHMVMGWVLCMLLGPSLGFSSGPIPSPWEVRAGLGCDIRVR